ncbi:MAG: hypothetical protein AAFR77_07445 [Cyanobacteria bacterium J06631_2]
MALSKLNKLITILTLGAGCLTFPTVASASNDKYHCQEVNGVYGVYSRVSRGDIKLMEFNRDVNQEWSIIDRCEAVAIRFQRTGSLFK